VLFHFLGSYFEAYEGFISTLVSGTFTHPCIFDWNNDLQFLLLPVYAYVNQYLPNIQVYGIALFIFTWCSLSFLGILLFNTLQTIRTQSNILFIILYCILSVDTLMNLSSNRIAFIIAVNVFWLTELYRYHKKTLNSLLVVLLFLSFTFACLIMFEVVILCSVFYLIILFTFKKIYARSFIPLIISVSFFIVYNTLIISTATEAKKVGFYKEKQFFDRNDINYYKLQKDLQLEVEALRIYQITDKEHFQLSFYESVSKKDHHVNKMFFLLDGVNYTSFQNILKNSFETPNKIWYLIAFYFLLSVFIMYKLYNINKRYIFYASFFFFFPILLCLYVKVPIRFTVPYYTILCCINVLICLHYDLVFYKRFCLLISLPLIFILCAAVNNKTDYTTLDGMYKTGINKLTQNTKTLSSDKKLVISNLNYNKFFPVDPFMKTTKQNALFLNFYFFASYKCYINTWNEACNCDALSLKDKVDYIIAKEALFIIDNSTLEFMVKYFKMKYNKNLVATKTAAFDKELNIYKVNYE